MSPDIPSTLDVRPATSLLKALSDDNRLRMVGLLARGEQCVCHIATALDLTQPNVSQHLTVLRHAGLVESEPVHQLGGLHGVIAALAVHVLGGDGAQLFVELGHDFGDVCLKLGLGRVVEVAGVVGGR